MTLLQKKYYHLLNVEYNGADYYGWQKQLPHTPTVHQAFDRALKKYFKDSKVTFLFVFENPIPLCPRIIESLSMYQSILSTSILNWCNELKNGFLSLPRFPRFRFNSLLGISNLTFAEAVFLCLLMCLDHLT